MTEQSFVMIKPDGMAKQLAGVILDRFLQQGLTLVACRLRQLNEELLRQHYDFLTDKPFFPDLLRYMQECPVLTMVLQGPDAIAKIRQLLGPTDSSIAPKGTIRGDFGKDKSRNVAHASDSVEAARREIARFFKSEEIFI